MLNSMEADDMEGPPPPPSPLIMLGKTLTLKALLPIFWIPVAEVRIANIPKKCKNLNYCSKNIFKGDILIQHIFMDHEKM
ncbi:hypothetical protein [Thermoplasma sp.]|uniref:hypothetical protein n=1 Tax=Thermoplasma sp. TaxID=1973142 RepID=UPI001273218F|nr:hypothetical protein [Thermoplasma sp.]KAA8922409.1 MAG: hypothetical protein F6Q11_04755 [Thermoplasma sp.]